jgi:hypothetical protein
MEETLLQTGDTSIICVSLMNSGSVRGTRVLSGGQVETAVVDVVDEAQGGL